MDDHNTATKTNKQLSQEKVSDLWREHEFQNGLSTAAADVEEIPSESEASTLREDKELQRLRELHTEFGQQIHACLPAEDIRGLLGNYLDSVSLSRSISEGAETIGHLSNTYTELRRAVLNGLLRDGEVLNLVAPPKTGKSWLVYQLLLCMVTGRRFLGYQPTPGKVLLIDNELHKETLSFRIPLAAKALVIDTSEYEDKLLIKSLRGKWMDIYAIGRWLLAKFTAGDLKVIVIDSWYRALPRGTNENDPGTMAAIYNYVDTIADRLGCAFVNIHHSTKGSQGMKTVTDVGSGSGVQSRAADTHLVLRDHEQEGVYVLDGVVRSWAPIRSACVRFEWPQWLITEDFDPARLKQERTGRAKSESGDKSSLPTPFDNRMQKVRDVLVGGPRSKNAIRSATKLSGQSAGEAINALLEFGDIEEIDIETRSGNTTGYRLVKDNPGQPRTTSECPWLSTVDGQSAPYKGAVVLSGVDVTGAPDLIVRGGRSRSGAWI